MSAPSSPPTQTSGRTAGAALLTGIAFALVGILINLKPLVESTLPAILVPGPNLTFREIAEGLPIPKILDWNQGRIDQLIGIRDMGVFTEFLLGSLILVSLWLVVVSILNPTFHLFTRVTVPPPDLSALPEKRAAGEKIQAGEILMGRESASTEEAVGEDADAGSDLSSDLPLKGTPLPISLPDTEADNAVQATEHPALTLWTMDRVHLEQAFRLLVLMAIPLLLVALATGGLGMPATLHLAGKSAAVNSAWGRALQSMALGLVLWLGFRPEGLAGRFGILHQVYQSEVLLSPGRDRPQIGAWGKLILMGLLFGVGVYALNRWAMPPPSLEFMAHYRALGTFSQTYWSEIALHFLGSTALVWLGAGVFLYLLGRPGLRLGMRGALLSIPVVAALAASALSRPYTLASLRTRFDTTPAVLATAPQNPRFPGFGVPDGPEAGQELAKRLHLKTVTGPLQAHNMIVFDPHRGPMVTGLGDYSEDGVRVDAEGVRHAQAYLEQHHAESALSWVAIKYLYSDATLRFDITSGIRVCLQDVEHAPHLAYCNQTIRTLLFVCAATPQNRVLLDGWADESRFAHPDRASQALMGDLYLRFGEKEKALFWYRKAEMPHSFMARIEAQQPLFHQGRVTGRVLLNGKPLAGVQVGVVPHRLNGLPRDLEMPVLEYGAELMGRRPYSQLFLMNHPRPYALRWVSEGAVTGADGTFTFDSLTEGEYYLACTLPSQVAYTVSEYPGVSPTPALQIAHIPPPFTLNYTSPVQNVGDIAITYPK